MKKWVNFTTSKLKAVIWQTKKNHHKIQKTNRMKDLS